jgi:hypothetical protein
MPDNAKENQSVFSILLVLVMAGIICLGVYLFISQKSKTKETPAQVKSPAVSKPAISDSLRVSSPKPNQEIASPVVIQGSARGGWFFEGSFPVKLFDANDKLLAQGTAIAHGVWMTNDFVPFRAELAFSVTNSKTGTICLQRDNPSDLAEKNRELRIPVVFKSQPPDSLKSPQPKPAEMMTIKVFFNNTKLDPNASGSEVFAVERSVPKIQAVARAALEELLKGPTDKERADGFITSINPGVKIQSLRIDQTITYVDFNKQLEFQVGGSTRVGAIRTQIVQTLKQFPTINEVIISIDGRTEDILQP